MTNQGACLMALASASDGQPQWVHLLPVGRFQGRDGRGPWTLDNAAAVLDATRRYAGSKKIVIDYEHQTQNAETNGQPAPAAGWITDLQARQDGIWGLVEWTERATDYIRRREYRYLSPTFTYTRFGAVVRLIGAGLTNHPNLELTALARAGESMDNDLNELKQLLGLPPDAGGNAITETVRGLLTARQSDQPDPTKWVPFETFHQLYREFRERDQGITAIQTEHTVSNAVQSGQLPPFLRDWGIALCKTNAPAFEAFMQNSGGKFYNAVHHPKVPRGPYTGPGWRKGMPQPPTDAELAVCRTMGIMPDHLVKDDADGDGA